MLFNKYLAPMYEAPDGGGAAAASGDTPAEGDSQGNRAPELSGRVTVKYKDGPREIDLSTEDGRKKAVELMQKGTEYPTLAQERAEQKKILDRWNGLIARSKDDDASFKELTTFLEQQTGRKLTVAQKQELEDMVNDDPAFKEIASLRDEVTGLKKTLTDAELKQEAKELERQLNTMAADTENFPDFDKEAVWNTAVEKGTFDFAMVYHYLNRDKILQREREAALRKAEEQSKKRSAASLSEAETGTAPAGVDAPRKRIKNHEDRVMASLKRLQAEGKSLITDE